MTTVLMLRDVHAGYGKSAVLNGVSLTVADDSLVALLGPNGSGKSTIAKTIMSLTTHYDGTLEWEGRDLRTLPTWRRSRLGIGYVPQVENVFRTLSVRENLLVSARQHARRHAESRLDEIHELFPVLAERRNVIAGNLSGGERRMLAFATTLVQKPRLLLLDEPTSDLAPAAIDAVFEKIVEVRQTFAIPILMIEQNVERARELADRICILVRGRVVVERPADDITEREIGAVFLDRTHYDESCGSEGSDL
jgi:ABC-type branched-subunit amino acid transport system ATPase component